MVIRRERDDDNAAVREVVVAAFGSVVEGDLVDRIRASAEYVPEMALVAEVDDEIVGQVMISGALIRNDKGDRPIVMLSPLAVLPAHQRQGIGSALVEAACAGADDRGEPLVVLEGNPAYYGRFGFEHTVKHGLTIQLPDWAPPEAAQVKLLSSYDNTNPALKGQVIYPSAFDRPK